MAFIGHPVLADIRKGIRLRPTQTVDKSKPFIQADGESLPAFQRGPPQPPPPPVAPPPSLVQKPIAKQQQQQQSAIPRPPAPPAPPAAQPSPTPVFKQTPVANGISGEDERQKLLAQIRGGVRLRHVQTVDKSGLVLDEEERQQLLRVAAGTPNGSLDSQGKSPSPSLAACSSTSSSALSPSSPPGALWPSDGSEQFPSPRQCSPSPTAPTQQRPSSVRHWPEVQLCPQAGGGQNGPKHGEFQFDEQKQIEERQKEVAALASGGGAQSKIAAFKQFQASLQQPSSAGSCTLPRAAKPTPVQNGRPTPSQNGQKAQPQKAAVPAKPAVNGTAKSVGNGTLANGTTQTLQRPAAVAASSSQVTHQQSQWKNHQPQPQPLAQSHQRPQSQFQPSRPIMSRQQPQIPVAQIQQQQQQPTMSSSPSPMSQPSPPKQQQQLCCLPTPSRPVPSPTPVTSMPPSPVPKPPPTPTMRPSAPSPVPPFFRSYTPRQPGGAHRQNFERIRGRFGDGLAENGTANGHAESAEVVWKEAARQRKEQILAQKSSAVPPPLPSCPPPPLDVQHPDWQQLREHFKFVVDMDGGGPENALVRIVKR